MSSIRRAIVIAALAWVGIGNVYSAAAAAQQRGGHAIPSSALESLQWRNIGPFRGGRASATTGVVSEPHTYYLGTAGGGVFKTTNAGHTWFNVTDGFVRTGSVGAIDVSLSDPNVVYVGMGESSTRFNSWHHGDGVYKSIDAGQTWQSVGLEATLVISEIRIHPRDPDIVYVAAQGALYGPTEDRGLYRSRDGGRTWQKILYVSLTAGASDLAIDPRNPNILYTVFWDHQRMPWGIREVGPDTGIYKSTDGGDSWRKIGTGLPKVMGKIGIAVSANSDRLYATVATDLDVNDSEAGIYRSEDAGETWSFVNDSPNLVQRTAYYGMVVADPQDPDIVYVIEDDNHKSTDGGLTFEEWDTPHGDHHDLWINPNDSNLMVEADDGGAAVSLDGGNTWSTQYNQPTGQFYRINADSQFPYRIYSAQQDNTTISIASWSNSRGINIQDFYPVGGGETAFIDFDPDDPELVYASNVFGRVTEFSHSTGMVRNISPYPITPSGAPAIEHKYRFKWSIPVVVSRHDPTIIYVGAQKVLRSSDRGRTWNEISPDLTLLGEDPQRAQQARGRTPADGANYSGTFAIPYGTLIYVAESPHDKDVLWTGSDDGIIGLTQDGGKTWRKLTLPITEPLTEPRINAIEVSPHDPAVVYVAATRFEFNDLTPYFFKTDDYGQTWKRIGQDLPTGGWARVLREDPVRRGLLYAGTENGAYVSFDDGQDWQPLQLNLPRTPVMDIKVHDTDLLAATSGRGLWILDNLTPLRQISPKVLDSAIHLFNPKPALRTALGSGRAPPPMAENPPSGAVLDFFLANDEPVIIEILDSSGNVVRRLSTDTDTDSDSSDLPITAKAGMNRVAWDLRRAAPPSSIPGVFLRRPARGRMVIPGNYSVRLSAAGEVLSAPLEILADPRSDASVEDFTAQDRLLVLIEEDITSLRQTVLKLISVHDQIVSVMGQLSSPAAIEAGKSLIGKLDTAKNAIVQRGTKRREITPPTLLYNYLHSLHATVNSIDASVNAAESDMYPSLHEDWLSHKRTIDTLLGTELDAFNKILAGWDLSTIVIGDR